MSNTSWADDPVRGRLNIVEEDGSPSTYPYKFIFPNGTLTDGGDGTVTFGLGTDLTFGSGTAFTWTFNSGTTDPTIAFGDGTITFSNITSSTINGGTAANDDITIQGTTNGTRTTSYVNLQPNGGNVGIGTTAPEKTLQVVGTAQFGDAISDSSPDLFRINNSAYDISDHAAALRAQIYANPLVSGKVMRGITGTAASLETNSVAINSIRGIEFNAVHYGSGTTSEMIGAYSNTTARGAGNVTTMYGVKSKTGSTATFSGTITNLYGNYIENQNLGGTITNSYGLYIKNVNQGNTLNYSIYSDGGQSYFGGNVGIGTTAPTSKLHLAAGTATAGTAPLKFTSGTVLTSAEAGCFEYDGTNLYFTP